MFEKLRVCFTTAKALYAKSPLAEGSFIPWGWRSPNRHKWCQLQNDAPTVGAAVGGLIEPIMRMQPLRSESFAIRVTPILGGWRADARWTRVD